MREPAREMWTSSSIPPQPKELIGREASLTGVRRALARPDCRLLTLLGPGGMGKTRLAIAAAESLAGTFPDGAYLVDLTTVNEVDEVPSLIAHGFDLQVDGASALPRLKDFLGHRNLLLVLDNFDHLLPAAIMASELLESSPGLRILVTSREPLRLRWEMRFVVGPLEVPDIGALPPPEELQAVPAVALFLERARAANMQFAFDAESLREIAAICVRLDGMPLAIELAAARTNVLTPSAILSRMEEQRALLRQTASDAPDRHQSLDAALAWSYEMLSEPERQVFRQLAVFVGGFALESAEAVLGTKGENRDIVEMLASLIDKGLVSFIPLADGRARYRLLETIRAYAAERLRDAGEMDRLASAHAAYFLSLADCETESVRFGGYLVFASEDRPGADPTSFRRPWPAALDEDYPNLVAALQWSAVHNRSDFSRLAAALSVYWWIRGLLPEGARWLEAALKECPERDALRFRILGGLGRIYRQQGEFERARVVIEEALAFGELVTTPGLVTAAMIDLGTVLGSQGRLSEARALIAEALKRARAGNDLWGTADASLFLGLAELLGRNHGRAEALLSESLPLFEQLRDRRSVLVNKVLIARVIWLSGAREGAVALLKEAIALYEDLGQDTLAAVVIELAVGILADVAPEATARLLGAADELRARMYARTIVERENFEESQAALSEILGTEKLEAAMAEGRRWSAPRTLAEVSALVDMAFSRQPEASTEPGTTEEAKLSEREQEVLRLIAEGLTNKDIGTSLGISENTAKFHVTSILTKLGAGSRFEAVSVAVRNHLL